MLHPLPLSKWNYTTAAHLLNRAGFSGPPSQIEALVGLGPDKAVASFLDYESTPDETPAPEWAKPDPTLWETRQKLKAASAEEKQMFQRQQRRTFFGQMTELRGWWLQRMAAGPRPFQEKMTLFWHGHFATSIQKVRLPYFMWRQNETFRQYATGSWKDLLVAVSQDPAMLLWLDNAESRKQHPNENYARELMELFTLGEGHYTEQDIQESARAFTGWSIDRQAQSFTVRPHIHDPGTKVFFGQSGNWDGADVVGLILQQPQAARFIMAKLWSFFAQTPPAESIVEALADELRAAHYQFRPVLETLFRAEEFYAPAVIRSQVKSPVQWLVSTIRQLERDLPSPLISGNLLNNLGQNLFAPPNVKGWDGGLNWITTNNLLSRYNYAALLVQGRAADRFPPEDPAAMVDLSAREKRLERLERLAPAVTPAPIEKLFSVAERQSRETLLAALQRRLIQAPLKKSRLETLTRFLQQHDIYDDATVRTALRLLMSTPDFQLT